MKINRRLLLIALVPAALFLLLTAAVCLLDVQAVGPEGSSVGLATLNNGFFQLIGTHLWLYHLTNWLGYLAIGVMLFFACLGLWQLITSRSFKGVDLQIWLLGALYVVIAAIYVFFEKVVVNCRPVLMDGELEASFPSSHTVLACVVFLSAALAIGRYVTDTRFLNPIRLALLGLTVVLVLGRLFSGVHWLTDILAGILLSAALLFVFAAFRPRRKKGKTAHGKTA